jgi:hypothetical protein
LKIPSTLTWSPCYEGEGAFRTTVGSYIGQRMHVGHNHNMQLCQNIHVCMIYMWVIMYDAIGSNIQLGHIHLAYSALDLPIAIPLHLSESQFFVGSHITPGRVWKVSFLGIGLLQLQAPGTLQKAFVCKTCSAFHVIHTALPSTPKR